MNSKLLNFKVMGDDRGSLISLEENKNIPFDIKRVYYIYGTRPETIRGKHSHPHLRQVAICVSGSCKFLLDDNKSKKIIELNSPDIGLYIGEDIWREMYDFTTDCVLMVLANEYYNEDEYVRIMKFLKLLKSKFMSIFVTKTFCHHLKNTLMINIWKTNQLTNQGFSYNLSKKNKKVFETENAHL
jgi:dTDP-4-dehydrorhamnose 3,5-epimerase-like enzyme